MADAGTVNLKIEVSPLTPEDIAATLRANAQVLIEAAERIERGVTS